MNEWVKCTRRFMQRKADLLMTKDTFEEHMAGYSGIFRRGNMQAKEAVRFTNSANPQPSAFKREKKSISPRIGFNELKK